VQVEQKSQKRLVKFIRVLLRALLAPRAKRDDESYDAFRAYLSLFVRSVERQLVSRSSARKKTKKKSQRTHPSIPTSSPPLRSTRARVSRVETPIILDAFDASPSPLARTLYSNKTGNTALQNVGRNASGFSRRRAHSVLAPFLCVVSEICASLRHFPIVCSSDMALGRDARREMTTRRLRSHFLSPLTGREGNFEPNV
jgi:hypothetical protein